MSHVHCNAVTVLLSVFISSFGAYGNMFCILALNLKLDKVFTRYSHLETFFGIFSVIILTSANRDSYVCEASTLACLLPSTIVCIFNFDSIIDGFCYLIQRISNLILAYSNQAIKAGLRLLKS